jgi:hypothetical protein
MYNIVEKNERRDRRTALFIAISLHIALAAVLYVYAGDTPAKPSAPNTKMPVAQRVITP